MPCASRPIIDARCETASVKPMFMGGMKQWCCLISAAYCFEWEHRGRKAIKYAIRPEHAKMLYLAGIYHLENHDGVMVPTFAVLS